MNDDKTEEPTSKKKEDSFKKGIFPHSHEVSTTMILAATLAVFSFCGRDKLFDIETLTAGILSHLHDVRITQSSFVILFHNWVLTGLQIIAPLMVAVFIAAIIAGGLQSGFKLTPKVLEVDVSKLSPTKGFGRLFNKQNIVQLLVDSAKIGAMFAILYGLITDSLNDPIFSAPVPVTYICDFLFNLFQSLLIRLVEVMIAIAIIDYIWQSWKTHEDLKMSKEEVKDERKQSEGDPYVKNKLRSMSVSILRQSYRKHVPKADVVVTNPTHYAVALKYEQGIDKAPVVVAKGEGRAALNIKAIAMENGVPMVENKPVARLLYKTTRVGSTIPAELYQAVAQILAHVYKAHRYYFFRLKARRMAERAQVEQAKASLQSA
jgi:flagellar biosynthesis protein FlhB